jgi:hypothetical protein
VSLEGRDAIGDGLELWSLKQHVELSFCSTASDCFPECSLAPFFVSLVRVVLGLRSSFSVGATILTGEKRTAARETSHRANCCKRNLSQGQFLHHKYHIHRNNICFPCVKSHLMFQWARVVASGSFWCG